MEGCCVTGELLDEDAIIVLANELVILQLGESRQFHRMVGYRVLGRGKVSPGLFFPFSSVVSARGEQILNSLFKFGHFFVVRYLFLLEVLVAVLGFRNCAVGFVSVVEEGK